MTTKRAWLLVAFLAGALFLDDIDRHAIFSFFPVLKANLHFSDVQLGLTGSVFLWVYAACSPFAGQLGDRFPKRTLIIASLCTWSAVTALSGFANSPGLLLTCRAFLGIAQSLFMPAAIALIADAHGPQSRSLATNLYGIGEYAGVAAGGMYGSYMAQVFDWRVVFFSLGAVGVLYSIPLAAFLKRVANPVQRPLVSTPARDNRLSIAVLMRVPSYVLLTVAFAVYVPVVWLLYTWFPNFLYEKFSLSLAEAGFAATAYLQMATLGASIAGGAFADRLYARLPASRFWISCAGFFLAAPCLYLLGTTSSFLVTKVAAVGVGICFGMLANLIVAAFDVVPQEVRASACGCFNLIAMSCSGVASLLEGTWKARLGIGNMLTIAALLCVAVGLMLLICIQFFFPRDYDRCRASAAQA